MRNRVVFNGTLPNPPTPLSINNLNGAPIRALKIDNGSVSYYYVQSIGRYVPPSTLGWTFAFDRPVSDVSVVQQAPAGYQAAVILVETPCQVILEVTDDPADFQYGAPHGTQLGPGTGSANQPIAEVRVFGQVSISSSQSNPIFVRELAAIASVLANIVAAAADTLLLASNVNRRGAIIVNDSTSILYVHLGTGPASSTSYSYQMAGSTAAGVSMLEIPFLYSGEIRGRWAAAVGNARVTELF